MNDLKTLVDAHASQLTAAILASLKGMSLENLYLLTQGTVSSAGGRSGSLPAVDAPAKRAAGRPNKVSASPSKRGPGRPKKTAEAAAPVVSKKNASTKKGGGRLARRSAADIAATLEQVVALLQANPDGLRSEQVRDTLAIDKRELPRVITEGMNSGVLSKTGEKRATTYFAGGVGNGKKKGKRG